MIKFLLLYTFLFESINGQYTLKGVPANYAVLGENYRLQCDVTDSPTLLDFRRNDSVVCNMLKCGSQPIDNRYKCGCINNNNKQQYLNISNIDKQDDTTWSCRGNTGKQGSTNVPVYYPPNITSITSDVVNNTTDEGSDVKFNCNVDSKPVSTITWSSSTSTDTNTGQQWTLTKAKCQDTGIYTCTANNGIGQSTTKSLPLNITCSPRINGDIKDEVKNRLGEEVTLLIDVIAYPKPSFKWKQESTGQELTPDTTQQVSTNNYISSLTFTIQQSSFGTYIVTVTNGIGDDKSYTIKLVDDDPKKPESPSELNIPAVVGGIVAAVVIITIVIVVVIVIKKRRNQEPDSPTTSPKNQRLEIIPNELYESSDVVRQGGAQDNPAMEILENDLYVGSDAIFGKNPDVVPKVNKNEEGGIFAQSNNMAPKAEPVYGQVNKPKKPKATKKKEVTKKPPKPDKPPPVPGKIGEGNNNEGVYQNTGAIGKEKKRNVEGLNYADVVFSNKKPTKNIQGKKEETVYVEIDPKKRGKPLPKEDDSD